MEPEQLYDRRKRAFDHLQARQQRTANRLSNFRLGTVVLGLAGSFFIYQVVSDLLGVAMGFATLMLFGYLALRHQRVRRGLAYAQALGSLNQRGIERATGRWAAFAESGAEFQDDDHPYASDLDLFGQGSLFQWINSAQTLLGRAALANLLKAEPVDPAEIKARQDAVTELAGRLAWRQRFESEGLVVRRRLEPTAPLLHWARESHAIYLQPLVKVGIRLLPVVTALLIALHFLTGAIPWPVPAVMVAAQAVLLLIYGKKRSRVLAAVYHFESSLRTYARMLELLQNQQFRASGLTARQGRLRDRAGRSAFAQIDRLSAIVERISNRENMMFYIVNILTLWDFQCMVALEEWKRASGRSLSTWLEVLAEVEALSSIATIRFEKPVWVMPTVVETGGLVAQQMGHPLIALNGVANDFDLQDPARIAVITGSNMSGKSTLLRAVGINLVLAYVGAPVCAVQFRCSVMSVWTSMRVSDNLEQNISSFYAELLRIKRIVLAARSEQQVCFLLDEVFKGTNSQDRHVGAKALITQLQKDGAYGLVSTHDLELGDLEQTSGGRIRNRHFREYYQDGEIRFDYTLRPGVSTTRNALYLIKMVGIDVEDGR